MEKGACIISILNEECMISGTDSGFVEKTHSVFRRHKHYVYDKLNTQMFGVKHYAAKVRNRMGQGCEEGGREGVGFRCAGTN